MALNMLVAGYPNWIGESESGVELVVHRSGVGAPILPLDNVRTLRLYAPWRSSDSDWHQISWRFTDSVPRLCGCVSMIRFLGPRETMVRLRLYSGPSWTGTVVAEVEGSAEAVVGGFGTLAWGAFEWGDRPPAEILAAYQHSVHIPLFNDARTDLAPVLHLSGRLEIWTEASAPSPDYFSVGMLDVSPASMLSSPLVSLAYGWEEYGERSVGPSGHEFGSDLGRRRTLRLGIPPLPDVEIRHKLDVLVAQLGTYRPVVLIPRPESPSSWYRDAGLFKFARLPEVESTELWSVRLNSRLRRMSAAEFVEWR